MYSNKENINILTSLLVQHGVHHIVVCPGARNAALVHNFNECPDLTCHPVTDERSAAFVALGLRQSSAEPVAVCVTSGSALLNVIPGAAEATYQHQGIVVISADRPEAWIGQMDGQTLPQQGALGSFAPMSVNAVEVNDELTRWKCNRAVNEALMENARPTHPSVHINVPVSEPLFTFDVPELPKQRVIRRVNWSNDLTRTFIQKKLADSACPMIILGQLPAGTISNDILEALHQNFVVLTEPLSCGFRSYTDQMIHLAAGHPEMAPDLVIYLGGNTVSKRLRNYLRTDCAAAYHITVSPDGTLHDVSCHTSLVIESEPGDFLASLWQSVTGSGQGLAPENVLLSIDECELNKAAAAARPARDFAKQSWKGLEAVGSGGVPPVIVVPRVARFSWGNPCPERQWAELRKLIKEKTEKYQPKYSQMLAVKLFEEQVKDGDCVQYANSMSVRLAAIYAKGYRWCNRGLNGIDGSISTAAGASLTGARTYCVTGDLSFFYDHNALWQNNLKGNFRILLLNNGGGGIFNSLAGLESSPAKQMVAGEHDTTADAICRQFGFRYLKATNEQELAEGITKLTSMESNIPMLLEVRTNQDNDEKTYKDYYNGLE